MLYITLIFRRPLVEHGIIDVKILLLKILYAQNILQKVDSWVHGII